MGAQNFSLPYPNPDPNPKSPHLFWLKAMCTHNDLEIEHEAIWAPHLKIKVDISPKHKELS